jgi:hypothetical protein
MWRKESFCLMKLQDAATRRDARGADVFVVMAVE